MRGWWLIGRLARYRLGLWLLSGSLASGVFYLFPLVPGLVVQQFLNTLTGNAPASLNLWGLVVLLMGAAVVRVGAVSGAVAAETTVQETAAALLRQNVFVHVLRRPGARALPASAGEAISRLRDDVQAVVGLLTWVLDPVGQTLVGILALVVLVQVNPIITLLVFAPLVVVLTVVNMASKRILRYRRANQQAIGEVTGLLGEVFGAAMAVKVARAEANVVAYFGTLNEARRKAALNDILLTQLLGSISFNAANLGTGVMLLVTADAMRSGRFTVGDFALFVSYLGWLTQVTSMFGNFLTQYRQVGVSLDRLLTLLQGEAPAALVAHSPLHLSGPIPPLAFPVPDVGDPLLTGLEVRGLTYRYPESGRGIADISFHVAPGSLTVVTGRIGAGKTTLLRTLLGLLPADCGTICWNGRPIPDPAGFFVPPRAAYTPQVPRLFSDTLGDNILLGLPPDAVDLPAALDAAVLAEDLAGFEAGLATRVGPRGVKLSGGQMQRAAAARMFVRTPDLLVVDDLSSALDVETERLLWTRLAARPGVTCLAVSHRRAALTRADHIVVLQDGRVAGAGTLADLLAGNPEMQRLWHGEAAT